MDIDTTVNVSNIITIAAMGGIGWATIAVIKATVASLGTRMDGVENDMKNMAKAITTVAVQEERLSSMDQRMHSQGLRIDEMRGAVARLEGGRFDQMLDNFNQLMLTMKK